MLRRNLIMMVALDALISAVCFFLAYLLRFEFSIPPVMWGVFIKTLPWIVAVKMGTYVFFGLYRGMWRYTSLVDLGNVFKAVFTSSLVIVFAVSMVHRFTGYPRSVFIIDGLLTFLAVGGMRVLIRLHFARIAGTSILPSLLRIHGAGAKKLLIIGAGDAGEKVLREVMDTQGRKIQPVGFMDDDDDKKGKTIHGVPVLGKVADIGRLPVKFDEILIAMPSVRGEQMRNIVSSCELTGKPFRTLPGLRELIDGKVSVKTVRNVTLEDLLGREELHLNQEDIRRYLHQKRILVTGAGGSIGSELVRQTGVFRPEAIGLLDISEFNLFKVEMECRQRFGFMEVTPYLVDIRNNESVKRVFREFRPQVVLHAAAYKHVPMQEIFPWEAVCNNVLGTMNVAKAAAEAAVERFVLVSTDKAVRPTNVMGATKRVAEMLVECMNHRTESQFMAVRFGNVMGSSGSAIPIFEEQIARGGPVTVTHPDVTRYFMSVGEAAQLILQAGALAHGGEIFVLDMGQPVKIVDLARDLIRLHGLDPEKDIPITFIGLRPGEKLYEELITADEGIIPTDHKRIMVLKGDSGDFDRLRDKINELLAVAATYDAAGIKTTLKEIVPEYSPGQSEK